jgi:hypothetical protein
VSGAALGVKIFTAGLLFLRVENFRKPDIACQLGQEERD